MENGITDRGYRSGPDIAYAKSVELEEVFRTCEKYVDGIREKWPLEKFEERKKEAEEGRREERSEKCADLDVLRYFLEAISLRIAACSQDRYLTESWV